MNEKEWKVESSKRSITVFLHISSWRGISFGAIHYYGKLKILCGCTKYPCNCKREVELIRILTQSEAKELTKIQNDNSLFGNVYRWKKGDETKCFDSKEDLIDKAYAVWRDEFPKHTRLVLGDPTYCKPEKILIEG